MNSEKLPCLGVRVSALCVSQCFVCEVLEAVRKILGVGAVCLSIMECLVNSEWTQLL